MVKLPVLTPDVVKDKRVLLRLDLDVPLSEITNEQLTASSQSYGTASDKESGVRHIEDDSRLVASLPTIDFLLKNNAEVRIVGHLGRPMGNDPKYSLEPIARWFANRMQYSVSSIKYEQMNGFFGWKLSAQLFLVDNIRFFGEEEENDPAFAKKLSYMADVYVNDAFAVSHRNHASMVGVAKLLPHYAGFHLEKEVEVLSSVMDDPKRPLVVLIGGAKIETKLPLVEKMHQLADYVLVGGKIAEETKTLLNVQHEKVEGHKSALLVADLNALKTDISESDAENFVQIIQLAKTVVWNGPLGKIESGIKNKESRGTEIVAKGIVESGAYSVVGGGDTLGFLEQIHLLDKFSFVSTGGGAMLAFLSGEKLPGIEVLLS